MVYGTGPNSKRVLPRTRRVWWRDQSHVSRSNTKRLDHSDCYPDSRFRTNSFVSGLEHVPLFVKPHISLPARIGYTYVCTVTPVRKSRRRKKTSRLEQNVVTVRYVYVFGAWLIWFDLIMFGKRFRRTTVYTPRVHGHGCVFVVGRVIAHRRNERAQKKNALRLAYCPTRAACDASCNTEKRVDSVPEEYYPCN